MSDSLSLEDLLFATLDAVSRFRVGQRGILRSCPPPKGQPPKSPEMTRFRPAPEAF